MENVMTYSETIRKIEGFHADERNREAIKQWIKACKLGGEVNGLRYATMLCIHALKQKQSSMNAVEKWVIQNRKGLAVMFADDAPVIYA